MDELESTVRYQQTRIEDLEADIAALQQRFAALEKAEELLMAADGSHYHCWHDMNPHSLAYRIQYPVVCCHCGEQATWQRGATSGHGPYVG